MSSTPLIWLQCRRAQPIPHLACIAWILAFFCFMHSCFSHVPLILLYKGLGPLWVKYSLLDRQGFGPTLFHLTLVVLQQTCFEFCPFLMLFWIWAMLDPNLLCLKDVSRKGHLLGSIPYSRVGGSSSSPIYSTVSWFLLYLSLCLSEVQAFNSFCFGLDPLIFHTFGLLAMPSGLTSLGFWTSFVDQ